MISGFTLTGLVAVLFAAGWVGVAAWRPLARRWNLMDVPNERSSHSEPTPRAGGVPMVIITLGTFIVAAFTHGSDMGWIGLAAACIAATGLADDLVSLSWRIRFAIQVISAAAVIWVLGPVEHLGPLQLGILAVPVTLLWIVGLTNAYNFMDGIDGMAGTQAVVASIGWAAVAWLNGDGATLLIAVTLAATALAFLRHNLPPATIFMGDVGSAFLGFVFAVLGVRASRTSTEAALLGALLVWPFLFDTTVTFLRRLWRRENVVAAHRSHIYQRLVIAGASHGSVTALYGCLALACAAAGVTWAAGWSGGAGAAILAAAGSAATLLVALRLKKKTRETTADR